MPRTPSGPGSHGWKGGDATYSAMHKRVARARGQADHCENRAAGARCRSTVYQWAHVHRTDPGDPANYRQLCRQCHVAYDGHAGSGNAGSRLTPEQVASIRARHAARSATQTALAAEHGVSITVISNIVLGRTYQESP